MLSIQLSGVPGFIVVDRTKWCPLVLLTGLNGVFSVVDRIEWCPLVLMPGLCPLVLMTGLNCVL